jgi:hypothetical protein
MHAKLQWYPGAVFAEAIVWGGYYPVVVWDEDLYEEHQEDMEEHIEEMRDQLYG